MRALNRHHRHVDVARTVAWTAAVVLALTVAVPTDAAARTAAAMAPLGVLGIPADQAKQVQSWLAKAARQLPQHRWLPTRKLTKLWRRPENVNCQARPACVGRMARKIGARVMVTGDVGSIGGAYVAYLKLTTAAGRQVRTVNGVLDPRGDVQQAAREVLYRLLLPKRYVGSLTVAADVDDAWVYLDGRRVGRGRIAVLRDVPVGTHAVRVTHEAYQDFVQFVRVDFEKSNELQASLKAFPVHAKHMRLRDDTQPLTDAELPWYRRWWAVATFGAVIFAAGATAVALIPRGVSSDQEETVVPP